MKRIAALVGLWLVIVAAGCALGMVHDGIASFVPNFLRYGVGVGTGIAVLLSIGELLDRRNEARRRR